MCSEVLKACDMKSVPPAPSHAMAPISEVRAGSNFGFDRGRGRLLRVALLGAIAVSVPAGPLAATAGGTSEGGAPNPRSSP